MPADCLFCRIVKREIPSRIVEETDQILAFEDVHPQAPTHVLVIPKRHLPDLAAATAADSALLGELMLAAARVARQRQLDTAGFRLVANSGPDAGQTVLHLHLHLLAGRPFAWPPG